MKNKKTIIVGLITGILMILLSLSIYVERNNIRKTYKEIRDGFKTDGVVINKTDDIRLIANKNKDASQFKEAKDLKGYLTDDNLLEMKAERRIEGLMTYEEAFNQQYTSSLRYDTDPNRMVWVIQMKYNKDVEFEPGKVFKKPIITNIYDAETGEIIDFSWNATEKIHKASLMPTLCIIPIYLTLESMCNPF